jgi:tryptophan synthase alpha chain
LRASGRRILAPYLTAGFPSRDAFPDLVRGIVEAGADMLEIGIPFSDPIMDGPVIQRASMLALESEVRPETAVHTMGSVRTTVPFVFMTYVNPVLQMGWDRFAQESAAAGACGVIIPDLPHEEAGEWASTASRHGQATVLLAAPASSDERLQAIAALGSGFVYCVSLFGVTGVRDALSEHARPLVERVRAVTDRVALVGLGVSTPKQAYEACSFSDGVIVGSAIIRAILEHGTDAAVRLVKQMREAIDG